MAKKKEPSKYSKKFKLKKGDNVLVIAGNYRGQEGEILKMDRARDRAIVEGINMVTKHQKPTQQNPQGGGIVEKEASIHISNLMLIEPKTGEPTRVGKKLNEQGKLQRYSKKTGEFI